MNALKFSEIEKGKKAQLNTEKLNRVSKKNFEKQIDWIEEEKKQKLRHKDQMFNMVYVMTSITYFVVLIILLAQVTNFQWGWPPIWIERLSIDKLALILSGFLAELLLLPKIILSGLFNSKEEPPKGN